MPYDMSRNTACKAMLDGGFEWILSIDSDVVPPNNALVRLLSHKQPFISAMYSRRSPPWSVMVAIRDGQWVTNFKKGSVIEVDLVGAGFLLMHRSVVENFFNFPQRPGHPVFDWRVNYQGLMPPGQCLSEDFTLCAAYRSRGGKVLVDTSVECHHCGYAESTFGNYKPMEVRGHT